MACHVVLWIPTIVYQDFSDKEDCIEKNISDIPGKELFVKVSLSLNGNIQIDKKDPNGQFVPFVFLKRESVSSNGLMSYRYKSTSDNNNGFRFTTTEFPSAIYHIIKSFYHKHEFHDKESDSSIKPFVSSSLVDIKTCDNKALCHYLKSYGDIISNFVNYIQFIIRRTRADKDHVDEKTRDMLNGLCLKARGYEVYMGILYHSKYNISCCTENAKDRELRHIACNIENGLRYILLIEHEFGEYVQNTFVSKMIADAKSSLKYAVGSIIIGIVSLVASIIIARHSTNELNTVRDSLQRQFQCIPEFMQESKTRYEEISAKQEEISNTQLELKECLNRINSKFKRISSTTE